MALKLMVYTAFSFVTAQIVQAVGQRRPNGISCGAPAA
jgi:hypothetical protein